MTSTAAYGDPRAVVVRWQVPAGTGEVRADLHLTTRVRRISRTRARAIIAAGDLRRDERPLKPSTLVRDGDELTLWRIAPDDAGALSTEPTVLHEDGALLVVDKPPDLPVHPSARYLHQTLTRWLRDRAGGERAARPCHRLDRETSGALVCAHTREAEARWKTAFADGDVRKVYAAVVRGRLERQVRIDAPLALQGEDGLVRIRMVVREGGLPSLTEVYPLLVGERTLVACVPRTGRQHQIRAHLAHLGHPLVGDKLYGMGDAWFDAWTRGAADLGGLEHPRHALHAAGVALGEDRFLAPLPGDLAALVGEGAREAVEGFTRDRLAG